MKKNDNTGINLLRKTPKRGVKKLVKSNCRHILLILPSYFSLRVTLPLGNRNAAYYLIKIYIKQYFKKKVK